VKKQILSCIALMIFGLAMWPASAGRAQETTKPVAEAKAALSEAQKLAAETRPVYHLVFVVREMDGDKAINSRTYSLSVREHDWGRIRTGSRVPVQMSDNKFEYQEVGINIDCQVDARESGVLLNTRFELSGVAGPDDTSVKSLRPVFRNFHLEEQPEVSLGKPTIIGRLDDMGTSHHFEFEVTATKMK
jgi:hypothetical protein